MSFVACMLLSGHSSDAHMHAVCGSAGTLRYLARRGAGEDKGPQCVGAGKEVQLCGHEGDLVESDLVAWFRGGMAAAKHARSLQPRGRGEHALQPISHARPHLPPNLSCCFS